MIWKLKEGVNPFAVKKYRDDLGISKPMAQILLANGVKRDTARCLKEDPSQLFEMGRYVNGMVDAVKAVITYVKKKKRIYIFADYDVDGFSSGYILYSYLKNIGADVTVKFPDRSEGYGISLKWCESIDKKDTVVITVDNGITAIEPVTYLKEQNVPVIIIDHHEPLSELPPAEVICDAFIDNGYGTHLCAGALAWKVVTFIEWGRTDDVSKAREVCDRYLPYAALATVSDVMPPHDENRAIVQAGLNAINEGRSRIIEAFMDYQKIETMRTKDMAWTVAPSLNACSRMDSLELAEDFFLSEDNPDKDLNLIVSSIKKVNEDRKKQTQKAIDEILTENDFGNCPVLFVDATKYAPGLLGIIAGKINEMTGLPTIAYRSEGRDAEEHIGRGSARGSLVYELVNYEAGKGNALGALGHSEACGVSIYTDKIKEFNEDLLTSGIITEKEDDGIEPTVELDAVITADDMDFSIRTEINSFGYTSSEVPLLGILNVFVEPLKWETKTGKKHLVLKMKDSKGKDKYAVCWNGYEEYERMGSPTRMNIAGTLDNGGFCRWFKEARLSEHSTMLTIDKMEGVEE